MSESVKIVGHIGIEQRPTVADLKQDLDHFEIDTIFMIEQKYFLFTVVYNGSKTLFIRKLTNKIADRVVDVFNYIVSSTFHEFKTITSETGS